MITWLRVALTSDPSKVRHLSSERGLRVSQALLSCTVHALSISTVAFGRQSLKSTAWMGWGAGQLNRQATDVLFQKMPQPRNRLYEAGADQPVTNT